MKPKRNLLPAVFLFFFLVLGASLIMFLSQQPPDPLQASIPASGFSAERAFRHIEALAAEPRPVGTNAHLQTRNYIMSELEALGLSPQIQETTIVDPESPAFPGMIVARTVQNVIARLAGTAVNQAILLVCHYDSVATAPGASDDGSEGRSSYQERRNISLYRWRRGWAFRCAGIRRAASLGERGRSGAQF